MSITIYYDGDCPFCTRYVRYTRLKETAGTPRLVDVRRAPDALSMLERAGYDLDKGMVVDIDGRRYAGADAMHAIALMSTRSGVFNRITARVFSNKLAATTLYPLLRAGRNLLVTALGRGPLRATDDHSLITLFSVCWGLFACFHFLVYSFRFYAESYFTSFLIPILGAWLVLHPRSRRTLLVLMGVMVVDAWWHAPMFSNHTILKNFFLLSVLTGGLWSALRADTLSAWFEAVAPIGRALLLLMYVFGVFHKLNTDFLDPSISCANALWREMPSLLSALDAPWFGYVTAYGTLVIETIILVFLVVPALRHGGIVIGIGFHMMLALSGYGFYAAFSSLSMALHVLFVSPLAARRIIESRALQQAFAYSRTLRGKLIVASYITVLLLASYIGAYAIVAVTWFAVAIPLLALIAVHGKDTSDARTYRIFVSHRWWLNAVSIAFFFNCITPYLGLKTAQSINMFANLRLEGGMSNHLVLRGPPGPFKYLEDIVEIRSVSGIAYLDSAKRNNLHVTYYDLLNRLERHPHHSVSYVRKGELYRHQSAETLREDIIEILHPRWFRKWFHFRPVDIAQPTVCGRNG